MGFSALTSFTILTILKTLHGFMQTIETESIATCTQSKHPVYENMCPGYDIIEIQ
jgi:hypothetical protein